MKMIERRKIPITVPVKQEKNPTLVDSLEWLGVRRPKQRGPHPTPWGTPLVVKILFLLGIHIFMHCSACFDWNFIIFLIWHQQKLFEWERERERWLNCFSQCSKLLIYSSDHRGRREDRSEGSGSSPYSPYSNKRRQPLYKGAQLDFKY